MRDVSTGCLLQVIEGGDFRLINNGSTSEVPLVAMTGSKNDGEGQSDAIMQLVETAPLPMNGANESLLWDEWDM